MISQVRQLLGAYARSETMVKAGLYRSGEDPVLDQAIRAWAELDDFLAAAAPNGPKEAFKRLMLILRRNGASVENGPGRGRTQQRAG